MHDGLWDYGFFTGRGNARLGEEGLMHGDIVRLRLDGTGDSYAFLAHKVRALSRSLACFAQ